MEASEKMKCLVLNALNLKLNVKCLPAVKAGVFQHVLAEADIYSIIKYYANKLKVFALYFLTCPRLVDVFYIDITVLSAY